MPKEVMERSASDNEYLHRDFHGALSTGIAYLQEKYGDDSVRDYLRRFTLAHYAALREDVQARGLVALAEHFQRVYATEGASARIRCSDDEMVIELDECPAVMHMREHGYAIAPMWVETTRAVNEALVEGTVFRAELVDYDELTGARVERFFRREEL